MAILSEEEFKSRLQQRFGDSENEEDISLLEDITDTVSDLRSKQGQDNGYKEKYEALHKKYRDRFFSSTPKQKDEEDMEDERDVNKLTFESLFTNK